MLSIENGERKESGARGIEVPCQWQSSPGEALFRSLVTLPRSISLPHWTLAPILSAGLSPLSIPSSLSLVFSFLSVPCRVHRVSNFSIRLRLHLFATKSARDGERTLISRKEREKKVPF